MNLKLGRILFLFSIAGICALIYYSGLHSRKYTKDVDSASTHKIFKSNSASYEPFQHSPVLKNTIPDYADETLQYILQNGKAPDGYVGGRIFSNREKRLLDLDASGLRIRYQEWDVHPKSKSVNRGAERLITGSDGSAYFTSDHYNTFLKIR